MSKLRHAVATLVAFSLATIVFAPDASAVTPPRLCFGVPATIVATPGGGVVRGTRGDDVIYGTAGADIIYGRGGNDLICGRGGNDVIYAFAPSARPLRTRCVDSVDLGRYYVVKIDGGSGDDLICGPSAINGGYWEADGGTGRDIVGNALGVDEKITGGANDDVVNGGLHYPGNRNSHTEASGGSGNDVIHAGESFIFPPNPGEKYKVAAYGNSGDDVITGAMVEGLYGRLSGGPGEDICTVIVGYLPNALLFHPSCETQVI